MGAERPTAPISKAALWTGWILTILPALFLILDAVMKFVKPAPVLEATARLGYAESTLVPVASVLLVSTLLYLWPRTAVLGASC